MQTQTITANAVLLYQLVDWCKGWLNQNQKVDLVEITSPEGIDGLMFIRGGKKLGESGFLSAAHFSSDKRFIVFEAGNFVNSRDGDGRIMTKRTHYDKVKVFFGDTTIRVSNISYP